MEESNDLSSLLAQSYPPLAKYWPKLSTISVQQALFLVDLSREAFYGGAAGGGKCLTADHDVLTQGGWKPIADVQRGELVASWADGISSWEPVAATHSYHYHGKLRVSRSGAKFRATPNHKWRAGHRDKCGSVKKWRWYDATELRPQLSIPAVGTPLDPTAYDHSAASMELLGWWLAEGSGYCGNMARFSQVKEYGRKRIVDLAEELRLHYRVYEREIRIRWEAPDRDGTAYTKRIPEGAFNEQRRDALLTGLLAGDGYRRRAGWEFSSSSRGLADDVQRLATLMGLRATLRPKKVRSDKPHYIVAAYPRTTWTLSPEPGALDWEDFDGEVYCLTIPTTGTFLVRHDGTVHVTGNSDALLAAALQYVDVPNYKALILRRSFTELSLPGAIMARAREYLAPHSELHWSHDNKTWTFPTGATLTFAYMSNDADMARYQSAEFQYVAYDELTEFTEEQYLWLFSRQRATSDIDVPLRMRGASNPGGIGHGWVKRRFVDPHTRVATFFPAKLTDHPDDKFREQYHESLAHLDDVKRRRLEDGDWDAAEGLAFQIGDAHLLTAFDPPDEFQRFESMDFGVSNPTCVLAWAVDFDGNVIVFDEYYQPNALISDHAREIEARRKLWWPKHQIPVCYADPSMWARTGAQTWQKFGTPATDITEFEQLGVRGLTQANNKRRPGLVRLRELLAVDEERLFPRWHPRYGEKGSPRMFIVHPDCPQLVTQLRDAPLNEHPQDGNAPGEIVDARWESRHGHATAAARYGAMSRPSPSEKPYVALEDERAEWLRKYADRVEKPKKLKRILRDFVT